MDRALKTHTFKIKKKIDNVVYFAVRRHKGHNSFTT